MNDNMQAEHATITKRINGRTRIHTHTHHTKRKQADLKAKDGAYLLLQHTHTRGIVGTSPEALHETAHTRMFVFPFSPSPIQKHLISPALFQFITE